MKLGLRGKLFVISLLLIGGVGAITLLFFASQLRGDLGASFETDLRASLLLVALVGMAAAVVPERRCQRVDGPHDARDGG